MLYRVKIGSFVFGVPIFFLRKHNPDQFELVDFLNDPKDTCIGGKAAYVRILIRSRFNS